MNSLEKFGYAPLEYEAEKASNSYLMSLIVLMVGMPLPIINLIATFVFYMGNRKGTYYVRWHCTQALVTQFFLFCMNSAGLYWTLSILFGSKSLSNLYIGYIITIFLFNAVEFIAFIYTAIKTRKGEHVEWWFYGAFSNIICHP